MGIGLILKFKKILFLVLGEEKVDVVYNIVYGDIILEVFGFIF